MLGLGDFNVSLVFILVILSSLLCIVYGLANWNKGRIVEKEEENEEKEWEKEEKKIEENL
jgi:hypothetical protein